MQPLPIITTQGLVRKIRILLFALLLLLFGNCQNNSKTSQLQTAGEKFYRAKCGNCHLLPSPKYYSLDRVLEQIEQHKLAKKISLTAEQQKSLISYLSTLWNK